MATTLTTKIVFQGRDLSRIQSFTTRIINYTKKLPHKRGKRGGKNIEKQASKWMKGKYLEGMDDTDEVANNFDPVDFFLPHMIDH